MARELCNLGLGRDIRCLGVCSEVAARTICGDQGRRGHTPGEGRSQSQQLFNSSSAGNRDTLRRRSLARAARKFDLGVRRRRCGLRCGTLHLGCWVEPAEQCMVDSHGPAPRKYFACKLLRRRSNRGGGQSADTLRPGRPYHRDPAVGTGPVIAAWAFSARRPGNAAASVLERRMTFIRGRRTSCINRSDCY